MTRVLLLGGTTEASALARAIAKAGIDGIYSYAGRTDAPLAQPLPMRIGGFGGTAGLRDWLTAARISHVIDATHPFAAQMSAHAIAACAAEAIPLIALERPAWAPGPGDRWIRVADIPAAVAALDAAPLRVFLAIGRQSLETFTLAPQHRYLLRLVDPPTGPLPLPQAEVVISRGPFTEAGDRALMRAHRIDILVSKNAGGRGASAKLDAARALGLPVIMIDRPAIPARPVARSVEEVMDWLGHPARLGV